MHYLHASYYLFVITILIIIRRKIIFNGKHKLVQAGLPRDVTGCIWFKHILFQYYHYIYTVDSRYLDFGYLEQPLISKKKSGPCLNIEI